MPGRRPMLVAILAAPLLALIAGLMFADAYDRRDWPHWAPSHVPCQSVRTAVLIRDALPGTLALDAEGCTVRRGVWLDPYSGQAIADPRAVDVDHTYPLERTDHAGGSGWSREHRRAYANALDYAGHLRVTAASVNRSKGAKGPDAFRPERREAWCAYGRDVAVVAVLWALTLTDAERDGLRELVATCQARH